MYVKSNMKYKSKTIGMKFIEWVLVYLSFSL